MAASNKTTINRVTDDHFDMDIALEAALQQIQKHYVKGAIMKLGESGGLNIETISTGSVSLDIATGVSGIPRGRITEIYGPESSGKTTLALHIVAEAQRTGGRAAFIDAEHALDPEYAANLGVDVGELLVAQPDTGEQGLEITDLLIRSGAIDLVVVDSVAALVPQAELDGEMGDMQVGAQARMMSKSMRKLIGVMNRSECTAIFINQLREKVGVMFGNPETTPGGRALKFYSSVRLDVRRSEAIKNGTEIIGNKVNVKVVKNKVAPPFKTAAIEIMYGEGISYVAELLDLCVDHEIVMKSGAWFSYNGEKIGQGKEAAKNYIKARPELMEELAAKLKEKTTNKVEE